MEFIRAYFESFWSITLDAGVWLLIGFAMAGAVHALVPAGWLAKQLGRDASGFRLMPIVKASLIGIPLPLCSCSVIPVAAGLRSAGASKGSSAAFAISTPQTGEESIPLTWALFGPVYALVRPVVAVVTAFTAGVAIELLVPDREREAKAGEPAPTKPCCQSAATTKPVQPEPKSCCQSQPVQLNVASCCSAGPPQPEPEHGAGAPEGGSCCSSSALHEAASKPGWGERIRAGLRHGFVTMPVDLAPWLVVGLALAALIGVIVPDGWIESNIGTGLLPMLAMLLVGVPLYICATSSTPLAYALVAAGLSPGAALVLLLSGPATNVATMAWIIKDLGVRALVIYLISIAVFAVGAGVLFDTLLTHTVRLAESGMVHEHGVVSALAVAGAAALLALLAISLVVRAARVLAGKGDAHAAHDHGPQPA